jgi:TonB family protein
MFFNSGNSLMIKKLVFNIVILIICSSCQGANKRISACMASSLEEESVIQATTNKIEKKVKLEFPKSAYPKRINEGCVKISFTINNAGYARNLEVVDSYPKHYFDKGAKKSLQKFKFSEGDGLETYKIILRFTM